MIGDNVARAGWSGTVRGQRFWRGGGLAAAWVCGAIFVATASAAIGGGVGSDNDSPRTTDSGADSVSADSATWVISAEKIYNGIDAEPQPGMVLIEKGRIAAVGAKLTVPPGARVVSVPVLLPGFVDAYSRVGLVGGQVEVTREISPEARVLPAIDWNSTDFQRAVADGVSTVHIVPGSDNVFAGETCIVKTQGSADTRVLREPFAAALSICSDPANGNSSRSRPDSIYVRQPTNRMGVVWMIRQELHRARQADSAEASSDPQLVALRKILDGAPVFALSRTSYDLQTSLTLSQEFGFQFTVAGGEEAYRVLDPLKNAGVRVIYMGTTTGTEQGTERTELRWNTPHQLEQAGISFCLAGNNLLGQAQIAVRMGVSPQRALAAITSEPAAILGLPERVGKIAVGCDADFVALSGSPWEVTSAILWTSVNGKTYSDQGRELTPEAVQQ